MGALGSDAAIEAADVVLMDDDPAKLALAMRISTRTLTIVRQNIVFALAVKLVCLLLGAIGIANMWVAIFADVGVMVLAVLNATRALMLKLQLNKSRNLLFILDNQYSSHTSLFFGNCKMQIFHIAAVQLC